MKNKTSYQQKRRKNADGGHDTCKQSTVLDFLFEILATFLIALCKNIQNRFADLSKFYSRQISNTLFEVWMLTSQFSCNYFYLQPKTCVKSLAITRCTLD